ncbi:Thoeris anti-defense Tad2 family protein [Staphylococcus shinii]|uniref:Thoeris anti-defense Tad2 family protein n=1 Tax=Staphylococcus shinii TaxID=2912228 RepID=UPI003F57B2A5
MNIQEATKLATKHLVTMTRSEWETSHRTEILPTNDSFLQCIVTGSNGKNITRYWEPSADDLMANDWKVINQG